MLLNSSMHGCQQGEPTNEWKCFAYAMLWINNCVTKLVYMHVMTAMNEMHQG